ARDNRRIAEVIDAIVLETVRGNFVALIGRLRQILNAILLDPFEGAIGETAHGIIGRADPMAAQYRPAFNPCRARKIIETDARHRGPVAIELWLYRQARRNPPVPARMEL